MSNTSTFALGTAAGLAVWYAMKDRKAHSPAATSATSMTTTALPAPRNAPSANTSDVFTLAIYPNGIKGPGKRVRWFRAESPITWETARDRLATARILDPRMTGPSMAGYWRLTAEPRVFDRDRAEPLPDAPRPRGAARTTPRFTREGRTILRDGVAILYVDRVDLGDQRFAISPHHADVMTERMVRLLNRKGAR